MMIIEPLKNINKKIYENKKTPAFVISKENTIKNAKYIRKVFKDFKIFYSVKTNPLIYKILENYVDGFEICEFIPTKKKVIYDNPIINKDILKRLKEYNVFSITLKHKELIKRVKDHYNYGLKIDLIKDVDEIFMVNAHPGTRINIKDYENYLKKIKDTIKNKKIKYLNLGGGIPDLRFLKHQDIELKEYKDLIMDYLGDYDIILELGRLLAAPSSFLVFQIKDIINDSVYINGSIGFLNTKITKNFPIYHIKKGVKSYNIYGNTLFSKDYFGKIKINPKINDYFVVSNIGAYTLSFKWQLCGNDLNIYEV